MQQVKNFRTEKLLIAVLAVPVVFYVLSLTSNFVLSWAFEDPTYTNYSSSLLGLFLQGMYVLLLGWIAIKEQKPLVVIGLISVILSAVFSIFNNFSWIWWTRIADTLGGSAASALVSTTLGIAFILRAFGLGLSTIAVDVRKSFKLVLVVAFILWPIVQMIINFALPHICDYFAVDFSERYIMIIRVFEFFCMLIYLALLVAGICFSGIFSKK